MVQLRILSGKNPADVRIIERFPCVIGRSSSVDLRLEDAGVWDRHLRLDLTPNEGITLTVLPAAIATVNDRQLEHEVLRNGDLIEFGAAKMQFWLSPTRQHSVRLRESMTWIGLAALALGQILLIYQLLR